MRFASCYPFAAGVPFALFKGDETSQDTQSTTATAQNDNRVGASEHGVAVGSGGMLDQSFNDSSSTAISVSDTSNRSVNDNSVDSRDQSFNDSSETNVITQDNRVDSRDQSFKDQSQTTLNTTDSRDQSDRRTFADNSVTNVTTLDAELAKASLKTGADAFREVGNVLENQLQSSAGIFGDVSRTVRDNSAGAFAFGRANVSDSLAFGRDNVSDSLAFSAKALEGALTDTGKSRDTQTGFLSSFYRDRENNDTKVTGDLIKYAGAAAIVGLLAWGLRNSK
ncbi:MAG: hypothetical protein H7343_10215 [Undibacterium sp.]|nr:hypothetical protein [Opitutaceae bacterium]